MNIRLVMVLGLMLGFVLLPVAHASPPETAQKEINYLLEYVEISGCEFYRNGSWYGSKQARAHLRDKYEFLAAGNRISNAEDFIEKAATASSLTGRPYQVSCNSGQPVMTGQWLRDALARYRGLSVSSDNRSGTWTMGSASPLQQVSDVEVEHHSQ